MASWFGTAKRPYHYVVAQSGAHKSRDVKVFEYLGQAQAYKAQIAANAAPGVKYTIRKDYK